MTYLVDKWIWLSFAAGFLVGTAVLIMSALPGLATIVIFRAKLPANAALWWGILMAVGWCVFEAYYAGFAHAHFHSPLPYFFATLGGGLLAALVGAAWVLPIIGRVASRAWEKRAPQS